MTGFLIQTGSMEEGSFLGLRLCGTTLGRAVTQRTTSPKCQGTMAVIAIIEEENELDKIIAWKLKQPQKTESVRAPPETANT
jgi:hypothetical protein